MLKRLSIYSVILLLVPFFAFVSGWHWQPDSTIGTWDHFLYFITQTAGKPLVAGTCGLFALFYFIAIKDKKRAVISIFIMAVVIVVVAGIKSGLKAKLQSERPFVAYMLKHSDVTKNEFFALPRGKREVLLKQFYNDSKMPSWLIEHQAKGSKYALPSGHSAFAAIWVMLAVGFAMLLRNRYLAYFSYGVTAWAILVLTSRLVLGMHSPADLALAIGIAWLVAVLLFSFLPRFRLFKVNDPI